MVVEDDEAIADLYTHMMALKGHIVSLVARDGEEALILLRKVEPLPDLILLDHRMPGVTGLQVLAALPPRAQGVPVILVTADEAAGRQSQGHAVLAVLVKPFPMDRLVNEVERALEAAVGRRRGGGEPASA